MKKKLIIALSTIMSAFLFALFLFGTKTYAADELPDDSVPTTTEVTESNEGNTDTITETTTEAQVDDTDSLFEITDEEAEQIAAVIGSYTNEKVEQLTLSMYAAFGVMGIVLVVLFILLVVFAVGKSKGDVKTAAMLNAIKTLLEQSNDEESKAILSILNASGEDTKEMLTKIFDSVKEAKFTKYAATKETLNNEIDEAVSKITKVE